MQWAIRSFKTGMKSTSVLSGSYVGVAAAGPEEGVEADPKTKIFSHQCVVTLNL